MQEYRFGKMVFPHYFCKHCGVHTHITGDIPPLGGELVMVQVNCLDDAEPEEIGEAPIKFINNLDDKVRIGRYRWTCDRLLIGAA